MARTKKKATKSKKVSKKKTTKKKTRKKSEPAKAVEKLKSISIKDFKEIPIDKLIKADWNYKKNDEKLQKKLANNIKENGQIENILVRELKDGKYEVVNGNHRFMALQELGIKKAIVCDLGKMSLAEAQKIAIETNETKFESDNIQLAELLKNLSEEFGTQNLEFTMPYSEDELNNFSDLLKFDWEGADQNTTNDKDEEEEEDKEEKDTSKSSTLISAGGDKFRTVRLELAPELAVRFETLISKLKSAGGNSERPVQLMVDFLERFTVSEIVGKKKKSSKKKK